jgi:hypothetical protein
MKKKTHLTHTALLIAALIFAGSIHAQWVANGTHIYNTNSGKVGIGTGTTTPAGALTVKGSGGVPASSWVNSGAPLFAGFGEQTVGNADYILSLASTLANARPVFIGRRSKGTLAAPAAVANNDFLMSFLASGYDGSSFQNPAGIDFYVDGVPLLGSVPARISFVTGSNSSTRAERLKIGATGNIVFNNTQLFLDNGSGNVGIGTSTPTAKLEINGQIKITGGIPPVAGSVLTSDATGLAFWGSPPSGGSPWTASGNEIYNNNSGNVGIGTTAPTRAKLEVNGVAFGGATSAIFGGDGAGISIQRNWPTIGFNQYRDVSTGNGKAIGAGFGMQMNMDPATGAFSINMQDSVAANASFVNTPVRGISVFKNGFVHLGNNNIDDKATLSISGSSSFPSHFNYGTDGHTYLRGGNKIFGGAGVYANRRPSKIYINDIAGEQFGTGAVKPGGDVIIAAGGGNVAIGIDNPDYKMLIYSGTPEAASNNTQIFKLRGRNPIQVFSDEFNTDRGYIKGVTNRTITSQFSREGIEIGTGGGDIYLTAAGYLPALMVNGTTNNVGIGTNNPAYRLDVCGTIRAKEVRVSTGWCDYVFSDDYKLRSLGEVEQFIKTNKHLPDVTAGNQIETEGLEVGKVSAQMIKKIEELTLYVIDLQKQIDEIKKMSK